MDIYFLLSLPFCFGCGGILIFSSGERITQKLLLLTCEWELSRGKVEVFGAELFASTSMESM